MRSYFILLCSVLVFCLMSCSDDYCRVRVRGALSGLPRQNVYMTITTGGTKQVVDSCFFSPRGKFELECCVHTNEVVLITFDGGLEPLVLVVAPGQDISLTLKGGAYSISGSNESSQLLAMQRRVAGCNVQIASLMSSLTDSLGRCNMGLLRVKTDSVMAEVRASVVQYINDNPYTLSALLLLNMRLVSGEPLLPYPQYRKCYLKVDTCLGDVLPNTPALELFSHEVRRLEANYAVETNVTSRSIGETISTLEFTLLDGVKVTVPGIYARLIIIDFCADWDGKMRQTNYAHAYAKHAPAGLRIVQVISALNVDERRLQLMENPSPWMQSVIGDPKQSEAVGELGVVEFPCNFVVDRWGRLVARNVYGRELEELLAKRLAPIIDRVPIPEVVRVVDSSLILKPIVPVMKHQNEENAGSLQLILKNE